MILLSCLNVEYHFYTDAARSSQLHMQPKPQTPSPKPFSNRLSVGTLNPRPQKAPWLYEEQLLSDLVPALGDVLQVGLHILQTRSVVAVACKDF